MGGAYPANNDVCAEGLQYSCGGIGASGVGTVFYASTTPFACGENMASTCNYLEVAPQKWNGKLVKCKGGCGGSTDKTSDWGSDGAGTGFGYQNCRCKSDKNLNAVRGHALDTVVGSGFANTSELLTYCDRNGDADEQARGYNGGGMTDWSLPSQDELNALYYYTGRNAIGGFAAAHYWSSTLDPNTQGLGARDVDFTGGKQGWTSGSFQYGVRPIRAF